MTSTDTGGPASTGADDPRPPAAGSTGGAAGGAAGGPADGHAGGSATIALIAAEAGVSVPTVSKVLNGRTDVAAVTRARVEEVIDRYQYRRRRARTGRRRCGRVRRPPRRP